MKNRHIFIFVLTIVVFLSACSSTFSNTQIGNNDWEYDMKNGYEIWHVNARSIVCGKRNTAHSLSNVGGDYVVKFYYNTQHVFLQCVDVPEDINEEINFSNPLFYIIDAKTDEVLGPLSEQEFEEALTNTIDFKESVLWINTKPRPEGAKFPE